MSVCLYVENFGINRLVYSSIFLVVVIIDRCLLLLCFYCRNLSREKESSTLNKSSSVVGRKLEIKLSYIYTDTHLGKYRKEGKGRNTTPRNDPFWNESSCWTRKEIKQAVGIVAVATRTDGRTDGLLVQVSEQFPPGRNKIQHAFQTVGYGCSAPLIRFFFSLSLSLFSTFFIRFFLLWSEWWYTLCCHTAWALGVYDLVCAVATKRTKE